MIAIILTNILFTLLTPACCRSSRHRLDPERLALQIGRPGHVEFFVMSMCPDTSWCVQEFAPVLQQVAAETHLTVALTFLGSVREHSVECMHGPKECAGNKWGVCVQEVSGNNVTQLMQFFSCQTYKQSTIPENGAECAEAANVNAESVRQCAAAERGDILLEQSAKHAVAVGVKQSCTIQLNGQPFCKYDGGQWKDCAQCGKNKAKCLREAILNPSMEALHDERSAAERLAKRSIWQALQLFSVLISVVGFAF
mmetsp:Transcript_60730/g.112680  ORF Transcript_60730/g.112680 Transcript_60730/m.112680 type:complete len:254 (+) Transcript_60730:76-837(+)